MEASAESLNRAMDLAAEFAQMRGRTCLEVVRAVLATRTLARLGYRCDPEHGDWGTGNVTQEQCDAAIAILEIWIRRASEQHQQG